MTTACIVLKQALPSSKNDIAIFGIQTARTSYRRQLAILTRQKPQQKEATSLPTGQQRSRSSDSSSWIWMNSSHRQYTKFLISHRHWRRKHPCTCKSTAAT